VESEQYLSTPVGGTPLNSIQGVSMDVRCSTCGEPWDTHHLTQDEIFDLDVSEEEAVAWLSLSQLEKLSPYYREKFRKAGWEFGLTVLNVNRCPACPKDSEIDKDKEIIKSSIEEVLVDDPDALAAMLEDLGY
jgi:hypothetical protein